MALHENLDPFKDAGSRCAARSPPPTQVPNRTHRLQKENKRDCGHRCRALPSLELDLCATGAPSAASARSATAELDPRSIHRHRARPTLSELEPHYRCSICQPLIDRRRTLLARPLGVWKKMELPTWTWLSAASGDEVGCRESGGVVGGGPAGGEDDHGLPSHCSAQHFLLEDTITAPRSVPRLPPLVGKGGEEIEGKMKSVGR
ncbi:hypothetical protein OsI_21326 [Oryza sativa Indica Group]|uniref:Uncharacterized protein n=1 Tax=Oryza sativa subsp. indica TaxID=39946 RepID=A2Y8E6_ORYSI|nr:hypothetical protein OsI_21326 [Oryza sativa Indica Group]